MESSLSLKSNKVEKLSLRECGNQIFATIIATLGSFGTGTVFGWSATAGEALTRVPEFQSKENKISWVISLAILGAFLAGPLAGWSMDHWGRRKTIILGSPLFIFGWGIMCLAHLLKQFFWLYIGRFITGVSAGIYLVVIPTYIKEICADSLRGPLGTVMPLMLVNGILYTFVLGAYCHWVVMTGCCAVIPVLLLIGFLFVPETPRFLIVKKKHREAIATFKWLYRFSSDELATIKLKKCISEDISINKDEQHKKPKKSLKALLKKPILLPIVIMVFMMMFQQFGGVNAVTMYTVEIFRLADNDFIQPHMATIVLGIFQVVFVALSIFLVDTLGRKTLMISCSIIMGLGLIGLGTFFYLKEEGEGRELSLTWLPVTATWIYIAAYSCGVGTVPWVLASELYNPDYRAESATIMTTFYWIFGWIVAQTYESLKNLMNSSGCFYLYACFCIGGAFFTIFFVPETKGKSTKEIMEHFGARVSSKSFDEIYNSKAEVGKGRGDGSTVNNSNAGSQKSEEVEEESKSLVKKSNNKIESV